MSSTLVRRAFPLLAATLLVSPVLHAHGQHKHEDHADHDHEGKNHAHGAHVHGVANLDAALDGQRLTIEVRVPGWDLVGFERAPRDDDERSKIEAARAQLADGGRLFAFEPAGACVAAGPGRVTLPAALADAEDDHDHAGHDHGHAHEHAAGHPGDWSATWTFTCPDPAALRAIRVEWFDAFASTEKINVQWIGPAGQAGLELTPSVRRIPVAGR